MRFFVREYDKFLNYVIKTYRFSEGLFFLVFYFFLSGIFVGCLFYERFCVEFFGGRIRV